MKKLLLYFKVWLLMSLCITNHGIAQGNKKLAQTGFQFLSVVSDGKAAAMAGAVTSIELQSSSLFFNPAGMANMSSFIDVSASDNQWIADIHHNTLSLAINPAAGRYGVLGFSAQIIDYGDKIYGTIVANNDLGYLDTGELSPSAFAFGVGYAKALSDRFSVGGQIKWVRQDFDNLILPVTDSTTTKARYKLTPIAYDFGTLFKTGLKSLAFGMSVRNFSEEIKFVEEGFQLPLLFTMGISMDLMDLFDFKGPAQSAVLSIDATHYRSHPEQLLIGLDYRFMNLLSIRGGYVSNNDEDGLTYGIGISKLGLTLDYAYTPFGVFDKVQRVTARFSL